MPGQRFEGQSGVIEIHEDRVEILRESWTDKLAYRDEGDKRIEKEAVTGIESGKGGWTRPAHISIQEMGQQTESGGVFIAPMGENSVAFGDSETWKEAVDALNTWLSESPTEEDGKNDNAKAALRETFARGDITEEEYRERLAVLEETK